MISRIVLTGCVLVSFVGCSSNEPATPPVSMCLETVECMVEECREAFEALHECVEVTGSSEDCAQPNLAHGRCTEECGLTDLPEEQRDAANALYLCEVDDEPGDCSEQSMTCEASG